MVWPSKSAFWKEAEGTDWAVENQFKGTIGDPVEGAEGAEGADWNQVEGTVGSPVEGAEWASKWTIGSKAEWTISKGSQTAFWVSQGTHSMLLYWVIWCNL